MRRTVTAIALGLGLLGGAMPPLATADPGDVLVQQVSHEGLDLTMRLREAPLRGPHFEVLVQQAGGTYETVSVAEEQTYLGTVDERPGAVASGIMTADGEFRGAIYFDRGGTWFTLGDEVVRTRGLGPEEFSWPTLPTLGADRTDGVVRAWDLAVDIDSSYLADRGGSVAEVIEQVQYGISNVRPIYLRDALLVPRLARVVVRASPADDPYVGDPALGALRDEWRANQTDAERDETLLVEGSTSEIGGGVAYRVNFDPDWSYAAQGADDDGSFDVIARHEIGHNFDVSDLHAGRPEGRTLLEGNQLARFSGPELQTVFDSRDDRLELFDSLGPFTLVGLPPYAGLDLVEAGLGASTPVDVLANDHDANGDALRLMSVDAETAAGGTAQIEDGQVVYRPPLLGGRDSFHYVVADACGQTATGVVFARTDSSGGSVPVPDTSTPTGPAGRTADCNREPVVERFAGTDRIRTAVAVSGREREVAQTVVLARFDDYADALTGGPLAVHLDAPLLLTTANGLSPAAAAEIQRLGVDQAVLLGGTAALSQQVDRDLARLDVGVRRLAASDRFGTAVAIAGELPEGDEVFLARGTGARQQQPFADALSASALAAAQGRPILLTHADRLPTATAQSLRPDHAVTIVGGTAAVSAEVARRVDERAGAVSRLAGADRYATSAAVVREALERGVDPAVTWVATGTDFPDGLVAGAAAGRDDGVLLLVNGTDLDRSSATRDLLRMIAADVQTLRIAGGVAVVTAAVEQALTELLENG